MLERYFTANQDDRQDLPDPFAKRSWHYDSCSGVARPAVPPPYFGVLPVPIGAGYRFGGHNDILEDGEIHAGDRVRPDNTTNAFDRSFSQENLR
jgi:hypothetical protein